MTNPQVQVDQGSLAGFRVDGLDIFRGVPYAAPPVGPLRFAPPQPPAPWSGVREARDFGLPAVQAPSVVEQMMGGATDSFDEDCLTLNIITPGCDDAARPVMVWIHGGGFLTGTGSMAWYDGANLARRDVVVVTLNYRLGVFGFLALDGIYEGVAGSGNNGIRDQIAALEWVQRNIAAFGGDPANVTVFGESAGAMSIGTLLGTPAAAGLFQRAILQSGSDTFIASPETAEGMARKFLAELGVDPADGLDALRQVPADELLAAQQHVASLQNIEDGLPLTPVLDGVVLPQHPRHAIAGGSAADIEILLGTTTEEMRMFIPLEPGLQGLDEETLAVRSDEIFVPKGRAPGEALAVYRERLGVEAVVDDLLCAVTTDHTFRIPAISLAERQLAHQANVYMYLFAHRSPALGGILGASHALDIPFAWDNLDQPGAQMFTGDATTELSELARHMADAWTSFARHGVPAADGLAAWPRYDTATRSTMWLEPGGSNVVDDPWGDERRLWETTAG